MSYLSFKNIPPSLMHVIIPLCEGFIVFFFPVQFSTWMEEDQFTAADVIVLIDV